MEECRKTHKVVDKTITDIWSWNKSRDLTLSLEKKKKQRRELTSSEQRYRYGMRPSRTISCVRLEL
jgi:hypothetical protein